MITDLDVKLHRKCSFYQKNHNKEKRQKTKYEMCSEILRDTIAYTFYRIEKTNDFNNIKNIDKHFIIAKKKQEEDAKIKKGDVAEYTEEIQKLIKNIKTMINGETLLLDSIEIKEIITMVNIKLEMNGLLAKALGEKKSLDKKYISFIIPVIIKTKEDTYIPYLFLYPGEREKAIWDPLVNLTDLFFILDNKKIEKIVIFDLKDRVRATIETPAINQTMFIKELYEMAKPRSESKAISSECVSCELLDVCMGVKKLKNKRTKNLSLFSKEFIMNDILEINIEETPKVFRKERHKC